jgi:hypothetical protein
LFAAEDDQGSSALVNADAQAERTMVGPDRRAHLEGRF